MNRRQFLKGLVATAAAMTASIPMLGPRVNQFYHDHFVVGDIITVSGSSKENNGLYRITGVSDSAITIDGVGVEKILVNSTQIM